MKNINTKTIQKNEEQSPDTCCAICKSTENIMTFKGKHICKPCVQDALAMR